MDAAKYFCDCTNWHEVLVVEPNSGVIGQVRIIIWWLNFTALTRIAPKEPR